MDTHQVTPLNRKRMLRILGWLSLGAGAATWVTGAVSGWPGPRGIGQTLLVMGAVFLAISLFASREPYRPGQLRHMRKGLLAAAFYMVLVLAMKPLLDMAGVLHFKNPLMMVLPALLLAYALALLWIRRRYQGP